MGDSETRQASYFRRTHRKTQWIVSVSAPVNRSRRCCFSRVIRCITTGSLTCRQPSFPPSHGLCISQLGMQAQLLVSVQRAGRKRSKAGGKDMGKNAVSSNVAWLVPLSSLTVAIINGSPLLSWLFLVPLFFQASCERRNVAPAKNSAWRI